MSTSPMQQPMYAPAYSGKGTGPRAGFGQRFGAALIDGLIMLVLDLVLRLALGTAGALLAFPIVAAYYVGMEGGRGGATLGKRAVGIRVISLDDGQPIGYGRAFVRYIGKIASSIVILLGYFWMLWDDESQCWHDKFAGDVVVPVDAYPVQ